MIESLDRRKIHRGRVLAAQQGRKRSRRQRTREFNESPAGRGRKSRRRRVLAGKRNPAALVCVSLQAGAPAPNASTAPSSDPSPSKSVTTAATG